MAIYTYMGAPVQIVEAEKRRRWWAHFGSRTKTFDVKPTEKQLKKAHDTSEFDLWWIKAKQIGAYPDGSGAKDIGKFLSAPEDVTKRGFLPETFFRADNGIQEIHAECEMKAADKAA